MMSKSPAFQFYPNDWLSSLQIAIMTPEQEGIYIRLLCYCWNSGECAIPDDDEQLAVLSRISKGGNTNVLALVKKCFVPHPEKAGFLTHNRLLLESKKQQAWKEKSSKGGKQRAVNKEKVKGGSNLAEPKGYISSSSSTSVLKKDNALLSDFDEFWIEAAKKVGKEAAKKAYVKARGRAAKEDIHSAWRAMNPIWMRKKNSDYWQFVPHPSTWLNEGRWEDEDGKTTLKVISPEDAPPPQHFAYED